MGPFARSRPYKYTVEHSVYVDARFRGRGLGKILLKEIIAAAQRQNYHNLIGVIDSANTVSVRLHEAFGFACCGTIRHAGFKFGRWLDVLFYQLILLTPTPAWLTDKMRFSFQQAVVADATELAALHTAVADHLTEVFGRGPWSSRSSEKGVLYAMRISRVFVAREGTEIVGTLRLATKKPWAIDTSYFAPCRKPLYLLAMAVKPAHPRRGIGRRCLAEAAKVARAWPADAMRLDAFDAKAGAGGFYARCGYTEVGRTSYKNAPLIYYELLLS